jgi:hypothetical protein
MSATAVTRLEYDTAGEDGVEATITLRRTSTGAYYIGPRATAADLPLDLADALRKWLEGAPGHHPPTPDDRVATATAIARGHLDADEACTTSTLLAESILDALEDDA